MGAKLVTLVFLEDGLALDKRQYQDWREVQEAHAGYKASLGPWTVDELFEYFSHDYAEGQAPFARRQVERFLEADAVVLPDT